MAGVIKSFPTPVMGCSQVSGHLDSTASDSDYFDVRGYDHGSIHVTTGITTLTFHGSNDGVTFWPLYTKANVAVTQTVVADRWCELTPEVFTVPYLKIVVNVDGTGILILHR